MLRPDARITPAILALLRGEVPQDDAPPGTADAGLRLLECGGYLRAVWRDAGRSDALPRGWDGALERAHRRTVLDTLAALAEFKTIGGLLVEERVPFILLKGGAYLFDLYDDVGQRPLTDIDLLVRPADASRAHRRLQTAGYKTLKWDDAYRRFEVIAAGSGRCSCEVHWRLGLSERTIDQEGVWERSRAAVLEGIPFRRLAPEDAFLYHAGHQADHFFGPSLKWAIDVRLMLRRWPLDPDSLLEKAAAWRVRTALCLALRHLEKLFPGEIPGGLKGRLGLGALRRWLVRPFLDSGPLLLMRVGDGRLARYTARCLLLDRPADLVQGIGRALGRVFLRPPVRTRADGASSTRCD